MAAGAFSRGRAQNAGEALGRMDGRTPLPHCVSRNKGTSRSLKALDPCRKRFSPSLQARPRSLGAQRGLEASGGLLSGGVRSLGGG